MLEAYKRMQANGAIGPLMKVDPQGKEIYDPIGEKAGTLVARPPQEYPKLLRRQKSDGTIAHIEVFSRSDELKALAENPDQDAPRSPLERERDDLATDVTNERKMNAALATQLENALARIEQLTARMDKSDAQAKTPVEATKSPFAGIQAEAKAVANRT